MSTFISVSQASEQLQLTPQRVRQLCREGTLAASKIGNTWLIEHSSLNAFGIKFSHNIAEDHPTYSELSNKPIALSFFSGAMGLDLGIEKSGFDIRLACEVDKYCRQTITLNRPNIGLLSDINECCADSVKEAAGIAKTQQIDLIVGGPPCQAFSTAGRRKGFEDTRGNVFLKYLSLCLQLKPKYFVIENVRGLLSSPLIHRPHDQRGKGFPDLSEDEQKGGALNFVLNRIRNSGYGFSFNLYNAANFGTPQIRERVIIVCSLDGTKPPYLVPTHSAKGEFGLKKWKSFRAATKSIPNHTHINFPEKRLKYYRQLKPGQNWRDLPQQIQPEAMGKSYFSGGGKTGFYRRLAWDKPSPTLVTHPAMPATDLAHPEDLRPLSIQEYLRIQEFPDDWELAGPLIQQYKQVGNAVPVGLGKAVGDLIKSLLLKTPPTNFTGFSYSRYKNTSDTDWQREFKHRVTRPTLL